MKLYHWNRCNALKRYGSGDIIVMAETVDEAIGKVWASVGPMYARYRGLDEATLQIITDLDIEDWHEFRAKLLLDLEAEPLVIETATVFVFGSE